MPTWTPLNHPAVVDLSHNNQHPAFDSAEFYHQIKAGGVQLVIHKSSQGSGEHDNKYASRRKLATGAGLHWEAYHFLDGTSAKAQLTHFLAVAELDGKMRGALDVEPNPGGSSVTPAIAEALAATLDDQRGAQCLRYTGAGYVTPKRVPQMKQFLKGPIWLAKYGPAPTAAFLRNLGMDPADLVLWQFSGSGQIGGERPIDLTAFNGTPEQLAAWPALARFPIAARAAAQLPDEQNGPATG